MTGRVSMSFLLLLGLIVLAVAMLLFYALARDWLGLFGLGMTTMIIAHITFQIPFVAIVVRSRLVGMDPALEEAAHDLGAGAVVGNRPPVVQAGAYSRAASAVSTARWNVG